MRYSVTKRLKPFAAAHHLPGYDGACSRNHGHNFHLEVTVSGLDLTPHGQEAGMVVEFGTIKAIYEGLIYPHLDHQDLNESLPIERPTTEAVAAWILERFLHANVPVTKVRLWETDDNSATVEV